MDVNNFPFSVCTSVPSVFYLPVFLLCIVKYFFFVLLKIKFPHMLNSQCYSRGLWMDYT